MRSLLAALCLLGLMTVPGLARADTPAVSGSLEQASNATPKEKADFAKGAVSEIRAAVSTVEALLADAQNVKSPDEKNAERVTCLERKLSTLRVLSEVAGASTSTMLQELSGTDSSRADGPYRQVAVALIKSREILAEAHACVDSTGVESGDVAVMVTDGGEFDVEDGDVPGIDDPLPGIDGTPR